jgi:multidrug efflux system membrane fusion protein
VIAAGLKGGETVVVEGQLRLAPGAKANPEPLKGEAAPKAVPKVATEGAK